MNIKSFLILLLPVLASTGCRTSFHNPYRVYRPDPLPPPPPPVVRQEPWVDVTISLPERRIIQGYVSTWRVQEKYPPKGQRPKRLPPGLAKKVARGGDLPPGWEKKLVKGQIMPAAVYERCHPLPQEIMSHMPPQPSGTVLIAIEGKVVRILQATREILDVFDVDL